MRTRRGCPSRGGATRAESSSFETRRMRDAPQDEDSVMRVSPRRTPGSRRRRRLEGCSPASSLVGLTLGSTVVDILCGIFRHATALYGHISLAFPGGVGLIGDIVLCVRPSSRVVYFFICSRALAVRHGLA